VTEAQQRRVFFESQLLQTKDNLVKAELALKASGVNSSALKSNPEVAVKAVAELQAQIAAQEVRLGALRGYLAESAPGMRLALAELGALRAQLVKAERSTTVPGSRAEADYVSRYRDFKYQESLFELFAKQFELAKVDEARDGAMVQVIDIAQPPERKSKPRKALIAILTTLASGLVLLLFVFLRHALRNSRRDPAAAEKLEQLVFAWRRTLGKT
jgi:uncharacterized protein involved in exopolysaccharide biosynthesis